MSKVKKITVNNLKAIDQFEIDLNGCTAIVTAGNDKGKSSLLTSLPNRLRSVKPDVILKTGTNEGQTTWELTTGEKITWQFNNLTKQGEKLIFITKDNIKTSLTKEIGARFFPETFDIDKFLNASNNVKSQMLQSVVGLDFTEIDQRYNQAFENRAFANKQLAIDKAKLVTVDNDLPTEITPTDELTIELLGIENHNTKYKTAEDKVKDYESKVSNCNSEILRLENLIKTEKANKVFYEESIKSGNKWLNTEANKPKTEAVALDIQNKINDINKKNELITRNENAKEINKAFTKSEQEAETADKLVKSISTERSEMIKNAKLPIGFDFDDKGNVTYLGHLLDRKTLSTSAIYIAALKLAALTIGEVRTLYFDCSYLDKNNLKEIENWAQANDLQLLIEKADFEGGEIQYELIENVI